MISIRPTQKFGSEKPSTDPVMTERAPKFSGLRPAYMPSGTPISTAINIATVANSSVAGMRSRISWRAGRL